MEACPPVRIVRGGRSNCEVAGNKICWERLMLPNWTSDPGSSSPTAPRCLGLDTQTPQIRQGVRQAGDPLTRNPLLEGRLNGSQHRQTRTQLPVWLCAPVQRGSPLPNEEAEQTSQLSVALGGQGRDLKGMFRPRPVLFLHVHQGLWTSITEQQDC